MLSSTSSPKEKISELVWLYIKRRPFLKEILRESIVNYSALARKLSIRMFGHPKKENAIKMALIRLTYKITEKEESSEGKILEVLQGTSLSIRNKVAVVISTRELENIDYISSVEGKGFFTYILEQRVLETVRKTKATLATESTLNLVILHSPPSIAHIPGVIAHILNAFSSEGINIVEFVSCYTDTLLVVKEADTARVYEILSALTGCGT